MGLKDIQGTALYTFLLSCIPAPNEIQTRKVFIPHELSVMPRYMKTLGTMCDYGVEREINIGILDMFKKG